MALPKPEKLWNEDEKAEVLAGHCARMVASIYVHADTCTIADLFFRPCKDFSSSNIGFRLSVCSADNSDFSHNRVPFVWKLPFHTETRCQNESNFKSPKSHSLSF